MLCWKNGFVVSSAHITLQRTSAVHLHTYSRGPYDVALTARRQQAANCSLLSLSTGAVDRLSVLTGSQRVGPRVRQTPRSLLAARLRTGFHKAHSMGLLSAATLRKVGVDQVCCLCIHPSAFLQGCNQRSKMPPVNSQSQTLTAV